MLGSWKSVKSAGHKKTPLAGGVSEKQVGLFKARKTGEKMISSSGPKGQAWLDTAASRLFRLKKGVMTTARLVNDRLKGEKIRWVPLMVTLTYRDVDGWNPDHISGFCNRVQMYGKRRGYKLPYVWVMELQKRGAPHYHVLIWIPARLRLPKPDRQGWWDQGTTNVIRVKNPVGYVAKYASKLESKECQFPKGARIHGIGGITNHEKRVVAWWKLPKDLRTGEEGSVRWSKALGGGWVNRDDGERVLPQWRIREAIWSAGMVSIERYDADSQTVLEREARCRSRQAILKTIPRQAPEGSMTRAKQVDILARECLEQIWREKFTREWRLSHLRETSLNLYVGFYEGVERGSLAF